VLATKLTDSIFPISQHIQDTKQIEEALDDGILVMLQDLPENQAVESLQRFINLDKSTIRSRVAYLAGLLRRDLMKINRR
jgi:hypothetical protein